MSKKKSGDYTVGYGKPPPATRFQPGKSGNPSGRPKSKKNFLQQLEAVLHEQIPVMVNGKSRRITKLTAMYKQLTNHALKGDKQSLRLLLNLLARRDINTATAELARLQEETKPINVYVLPDDLKL